MASLFSLLIVVKFDLEEAEFKWDDMDLLSGDACFHFKDSAFTGVLQASRNLCSTSQMFFFDLIKHYCQTVLIKSKRNPSQFQNFYQTFGCKLYTNLSSHLIIQNCMD